MDKTVHLSDFRGKKVLLWTWASWCTCRFDLAGWQSLYADLHDQHFEIVACTGHRGYGRREALVRQSRRHFTALVDPHHTVSSLYQMVNVPTGVWIDESGNIVRPPEVAYSKQQTVLGREIGDDRYALGVRDWVAKRSQQRLRAGTGGTAIADFRAQQAESDWPRRIFDWAPISWRREIGLRPPCSGRSRSASIPTAGTTIARTGRFRNRPRCSTF